MFDDIASRRDCQEGIKENKQNRAFIGLPLNRKQMLSHVQLCQFRSGLTFAQRVNLTVYIP